ncbi:phage head closure protein [Pararhizobium arenae]|uniref:phage head closure protein n=1 Tax=Pararhizobium arenae TaxID=1856850 RepID=UPI00094B462F|nr:phage head closure protein [Pararhizobium arenae]
MGRVFFDPGALSASIEIERPVLVSDGQGGEIGGLELVGGAWARIEPVSAVMREAGGLQQVTVTHEILVRYRDDLVSGMRLAKGARRFLVQAVHDPDESGRYLVCRCTEEGTPEMPLEKIKRPKVTASFVVAAARCGTTNALRPFLVPREAAFVAILHVPEGTCEFYKRAAHALIAEPMPIDEAFNELAVVVALYDRAVDASTVFKQYRYGRQIVLVTEKLEHVPLETIASADIVREIKPPTPVHFMAAARDVGLRGVTPEIAEFFTEFSFDVLAAVVRGNRPVASVVRHLKRMKFEKAKADAVPVKPKGPGLEGMSGYGDAKTWGLQLAEDLRAWKAGELEWEDVDRGMLLHGPPGTGKTSFAKALANTCDVNLVVASAARWQAAGHLGDFLKAMRSSFAEAKRNAPSILFVDEFDSFGDREGGGDDHHRDYRRQAINGMLECLDPAEGREGVVVVGATNNPSGIDRALLRSGRLEKVIEVPLPDAVARGAILKHHLRDAELKGDVQREGRASARIPQRPGPRSSSARGRAPQGAVRQGFGDAVGKAGAA